MANYSTDLSFGSQIDLEGADDSLNDILLVDVSSAGKPAVRSLVDTPKRTFKFRHSYLTSTQRDELDAFYLAQRPNTFTFVWPRNSVSYTVKFGAQPKVTMKPQAGGKWHFAEIVLMEA